MPSFGKRISSALDAMFRRRRLERDMAEELRHHLDELTRANIEEGMAPEEARYAALRRFGGVDQIGERCRDTRGLAWWDALSGDLRAAARSVLRGRGFTATVLLTIAICLAANVMIFAVVNSALLRPLPFREGGRLVAVHNNYPKAGIHRAGVGVPDYLERRSGITAFEESGAIRPSWVRLDTAAGADNVTAAAATPSFFRVLGAQAALGRTFSEDEGVTGRDKVVLLTDGLWRERYNADPLVIGRTIQIDETPYTIVGVMPAGFHYLSERPVLWLALSFSADDRRQDHRHGSFVEMIARLRPGATIATAQAQLDTVDEEARKLDPLAEQVRTVGYFSNVADLRSDHASDLRPVLLLLQTGVLFLLLIGIVNLANLYLVRATGRTKEYSLRQVLGARQVHLVRALLVEAVLLSLAGGILGLGLAAAALRGLTTLAANRLPVDMAPELGAAVCAAALAASLGIGLVLALPVIWLTLRGNLAVALTVESRGGTTTRSVHRLRHTLIVAQIALAFVLLSGTGLLGLSFARLLDVAPGFRKENLVSGVVSLPWWKAYKQPSQQAAVMGTLLSAFRSLPGVTSAALSDGVPFGGRTWVQAFSIVGSSVDADEFVKEGLFVDQVSGDYFTTLGIPLREGRYLDEDDARLNRKVCVIDEEFARRHWPHGSAIGSRIALPYNPLDPVRDLYSIVGVVGSVKQQDLADQGPHGAAYFPIRERSDFMITVRTEQAPTDAEAAFRKAVLGVDPSLQIYDLKPMALRIDDSLSNRRAPLALAAVFAGVSLLLAALGIYGVLAYSVAQRRREIGVRMALGAQPAQIFRQFLGLGLKLLCVAVPIGMLGSWMAGRAMADLLYGVAPLNALVLGGTAVLTATVALPACLLPSQRAARVAPNEALRAD
jgi:predicted permease